jgi:hypothetical protein
MMIVLLMGWWASGRRVRESMNYNPSPNIAIADGTESATITIINQQVKSLRRGAPRHDCLTTSNELSPSPSSHTIETHSANESRSRKSRTVPRRGGLKETRLTLGARKNDRRGFRNGQGQWKPPKQNGFSYVSSSLPSQPPGHLAFSKRGGYDEY